MSNRWIAYGLLGIACGLGQAAERGGSQEISMSASEEREACLRRSMSGAVDIYALRSLGRAEASVIGMKLDRGAEQAYPEWGSEDREAAREGAVDIYALRHPGRAEAHEVRVPGYEAEAGDRRALRDPGREEGVIHVYDLRQPGREASREIADPCSLEPRRPA